MNISIIRNLVLAVILLCETTVAFAQDYPKLIADRIGDLGLPAATLASISASIAAVDLYTYKFRQADRLDNASWEIILKQLDVLAKKIGAKAEQTAHGSSQALRTVFIAELSKLDPKHLAELAIFLASTSGEAWLKTNARYEAGLPDAFLFAASHSIASRQRGSALREKLEKSRHGPGYVPPLLTLNAAVNSPEGEMPFFVAFHSIDLLAAADGKFHVLAEEAAQMQRDGINNGLSLGAYFALTKAFNAAVRSLQATIDIFGIKERNLDSSTKTFLQDLVERSSVAVNTNQTILPQDPALKQETTGRPPVIITAAKPIPPQELAAKIAASIGPLGPRAANLVAIASSMSTVGLYAGRFPHADRLDDASWEIVRKQLGILAKQVGAKAEREARDSNRALQMALVAELSKLDPRHLAELAGFLESASGETWRQANARYEEGLSNAFQFAAAHMVASRKRGEALRTKFEMPRAGPGQIPVILVLHAAIFSPGNEPTFYAAFSGIPLLGAADPKFITLANDAAQALSDGMKNGLSSAAFLAMTKSFMSAVRSPQTTINMYELREQDLETATKTRMQDLIARSFAAMNGAQTSHCRFALGEGVIRDIGTDVGKIMSGSAPIKPGSVEHSWVAMSFERGCDGIKDFSIALKVWEDLAAAGNVHSYCRIAEYYRLGVGTKPDAARSQKWKDKFKALDRGVICEERMAFNPQKPWAGLSN